MAGQKAAVWAKVRAKYPGVKVGGKGNCDEITPAMIDAGVDKLIWYEPGDDNIDLVVVEIYAAMQEARLQSSAGTSQRLDDKSEDLGVSRRRKCAR